MSVGTPVLLYTVDDQRNAVWVIGLPGGEQLPRSGHLPEDLDAILEDRLQDDV